MNSWLPTIWKKNTLLYEFHKIKLQNVRLFWAQKAGFQEKSNSKIKLLQQLFLIKWDSLSLTKYKKMGITMKAPVFSSQKSSVAKLKWGLFRARKKKIFLTTVCLKTSCPLKEIFLKFFSMPSNFIVFKLYVTNINFFLMKCNSKFV